MIFLRTILPGDGQAETREDARKELDLCVGTCEAKYPKAIECLVKDHDELLTFYEFPPSTGRALGRQVPPRARSPPSATAGTAPRDA